MRKARVVFLLVWVASVLTFHVSPVFCASDVDRIEQLIKTKGKKNIITTICSNNQNNITYSMVVRCRTTSVHR